MPRSRQSKLTFYVNLKEAPWSLRDGLRELAAEYPILFDPRPSAVELQWTHDPRNPGYVLVRGRNLIHVTYGRACDAFRALGCVLAGEPADGVDRAAEKAHFDTLGVMLDCSRNGVPRVESIKTWLRRQALMGVNALFLYTEDTYQVPGEPYFGYMRGRYTQRELREIDAYAAVLGVEVIPCIQTLAHLSQILKWPVYEGIRDTQHELLVGEPATYKLLEKMIRAASEPVRSRRIHIGMDEAVTLGTGRYREFHGDRPTFQIMTEHLDRVCAITRKLGLKPMMWDDMFFVIGSEKGDYYDDESVIPESVRRAIPPDLELIYWDYYHTSISHYRRHIAKHAALGRRVIGAPAIYTHGRFWPDHGATRATVVPFLKAARRSGLKDMLLACWFDSGAECNLFTALPMLQMCADLGYGGSQREARTAARVLAVCGMSFEDYEQASMLDAPPGKTASQAKYLNTSRPLLWEDPINGLLVKNVPRAGMNRHYRSLAAALDRASRSDRPGLIKRAAQIARVLSIKAELPCRLMAAYGKRDRAALRRMARNDVAVLKREMERLWKLHRAEWLAHNKPFGFEVLDGRYGTLLARLDTLGHRLEDFAAGRIDRIEEWDEKRLLLSSRLPIDTGYVKGFRELITTTVTHPP